MNLTALALIVFSQAPPLTGKFYFDVPAGDATHGLDRVIHTYQVDAEYLFPAPDFAGIQTSAVKGFFTPCEALRQLIQGTSIDIAVLRGQWEGERKRECLQLPSPPPPPVKRHRKRARSIIDAPRPCQCKDIGGIPVPLCEDDQDKLFFAHECAP